MQSDFSAVSKNLCQGGQDTTRGGGGAVIIFCSQSEIRVTVDKTLQEGGGGCMCAVHVFCNPLRTILTRLAHCACFLQSRAHNTN